MTLIHWNKQLEIGIPFVDTDHRVLVNLLNQLHSCVDQREELTVLDSVLSTLLEYTNYHFRREEKLLEICAYPLLEEHKDSHRLLEGEVRDLCRVFRYNRETVKSDDVKAFLNQWLLEHIMGEDVSYRRHCVDNIDARTQATEMAFLVPTKNLEDLRVMLVDDSANFRALIKTILHAVGVRNLDLVGDAQEAITRLTRRPVDIVFCDWVMDGMNGSEFAYKVHQMALPTKVVLMTGYSIDILQERSTQTGVSAFLEKPIQARQLLEMITSTLREPIGV
ncbi:bacteriohemerythrin [Varunaivibrio sulfuroxidans]|uniref:Hemerythrin-like metal-binding protein n=1 Tax=Varunaivibrio sulfuroxidans TaxID=1773489 RepID=A0A4R3J8S8_9PROT|nr:bacteriohemerythrin [Varunaivibrio sulfuroxidans]TCS61333.1 hemerythrin-like metal-binding protein [Varunaivibrio sulfuroxidans]WES31054.1 bacteriohemerythrin [Varunaivibrio sulfuroxidans]